MPTDDRLRAKPPATDPDDWTRGRVEAVDHREGRVAVVVAPAEGDQEGSVELTVSEAIYDLFTGRLDPGDRSEAGDVDPGTTVWFRKKGG